MAASPPAGSRPLCALYYRTVVTVQRGEELIGKPNWWERPQFLAAIILLSTLPLLWPENAPLVDLPGHMARYRVELNLQNSESLQRYFEFQWALIGNLGVDLLVIPLAPLLGLEAAVKMIVLLIPPLTVLGIFWIAKETHGKVTPASLFCVPFVYGFPFNFGFLNFCLSVALALNAFAFWLRLTHRSRLKFRCWLFIPISCAIWLVHAFGWGILGLLTFTAELVRLQRRKGQWWSAAPRAAVAVLPIMPPIILMIAWRSDGVGGNTEQFFDISHKLWSLTATLRDRWRLWDAVSLAPVLLLIVATIREPMLSFSPKLIIAAGVLALTFLFMPWVALGSAYADVRLPPLIFILALLAIRVAPGGVQVERRLAWLGLAFTATRLLGNTASFAIADRQQREWLTGLDFIPHGAPVLTLVGDYCNMRWAMPRHFHVASFVVIRRHGYSNDQWQMAGAQLLRINYPSAGRYVSNETAFVLSNECKDFRSKGYKNPASFKQDAELILNDFPRDAFDFVWMIDPAEADMSARPGLAPIWRTDNAVLFRVDRTSSDSVRQ